MATGLINNEYKVTLANGIYRNEEGAYIGLWSNARNETAANSGIGVQEGSTET